MFIQSVIYKFQWLGNDSMVSFTNLLYYILLYIFLKLFYFSKISFIYALSL
jgi:hypothetical protein